MIKRKAHQCGLDVSKLLSACLLRTPTRTSAESRLQSDGSDVRGMRGGRRAPRNLLAELYRPQESHETRRRRTVSARPAEGARSEPFADTGAPRFGYQERLQAEQ